MGSKRPTKAASPDLQGPLKGAYQQSIYDLQRQASGKGPSIAREQLKAAQERTLASQLAAAQARPTRNVSGLQRQLIQERGTTGREVAQIGAVARAQEIQGARDALLNEANTNLNRQAGMFSTEQARQMEVNKQQRGETGALLGAVGTLAGTYFGGPAGGTAGGALGQSMSDEKAKENIKPADKKVKSFLDSISAKEYNYKPEYSSDTAKKVGFMAQDLEKSELGKSMVKEQNGVKTVDMDRTFSAMLAAQAELNKRLNKLEKKKS